jgi:very-short-patch-repair endonuclease
MPEFRPRPTRLAQKLRSNATAAERCLWQRLSRRQLGGYKFSRQMPVGPFICDFMCREARLVIEVDGGQHDPLEGRDRQRTAYIEAEGYRVIRFWNNEVLGNPDGVLAAILAALESAHPRPLPHAGGEAG